MEWTKLRMALIGVGALIVFASVTAHADSAQSNYTAFCAKCHGATGHGDGPGAAALSTKARDFANCAVMSKISDDTMFKVIKGGGASAGLPADMPSWSNGLSDDEIHALVAYIHTFCKK